MANIPDKYLDLLQRKKAFAVLSTLMPDGSPQVTPVWFDYTNGLVRVNTAKGRVKARNLKQGARVAMAIVDPDNPYRYVQIRGRVRGSARRAPRSTSIRSARNISGRTNIPTRSRAKCACCARSSQHPHPEWAERPSVRVNQWPSLPTLGV